MTTPTDRTCGNCGKHKCCLSYNEIKRGCHCNLDDWTPIPAPVAEGQGEQIPNDCMACGTINCPHNGKSNIANCQFWMSPDTPERPTPTVPDILAVLDDLVLIDNIARDYEGMSASWMMLHYRAAVREGIKQQEGAQ